ncbi:MAG: adenosylcobinamide-GDP ribazoletransferase [Methylobacteriaceae bacterium]|nr:adenosylcobinamide-GDP ribazoletransferase [Methylobacteriaceae bacterium]
MSDVRAPFSRLGDSARGVGRDLLTCLRFYSRLPLPAFDFEASAHELADFGHAIRMVPVAGAIIGALGGAALLVAWRLGLPPLLAAAAALAVQLRVTGGLHEDGLADMADGLGGGSDRAQKLAIMRDSRIGAYGAAALAIALIARAAAIAALIERTGALGGVAALIAAAAVSRTISLVPLFLLPPARTDGAAHAAGKPCGRALFFAVAVSAGLAVALGVPTAGWALALIALVLSAGAGLYVAHLAGRHLGGHTGDVAGAAQQLAEIAFLSALLLRTHLG